MVILLQGCLIVVILGSLYPFDLDMALSIDRFQGLSKMPKKSDLIANVLLFCPYGFVLTLSSTVKRLFYAWIILGLLVALGVQVAQIYVTSRQPALWDVILNAVGICMGIVLAQAVSRDHRPVSPLRLPIAAIVPLACYLAFQLAPFVPVRSMAQLALVAQRFLEAPLFSFHATARGVLVTLAVYAVLCGTVGTKRSRLLVSSAVLTVFLIKPLITNSGASGAGHIGLVLAWAVAMSWQPTRNALIAIATSLLLLYAWDGLMPFDLRHAVIVPDLLPLKELVAGVDWLAVSLAAVWKGFLFSSAFVLLRIATGRQRLATAVVLLTAAAVELAQMFVATGTPSTADVFLVAALTLLLYQATTNAEREPAGTTGYPTAPYAATPPESF